MTSSPTLSVAHRLKIGSYPQTGTLTINANRSHNGCSGLRARIGFSLAFGTGGSLALGTGLACMGTKPTIRSLAPVAYLRRDHGRNCTLVCRRSIRPIERLIIGTRVDVR